MGILFVNTPQRSIRKDAFFVGGATLIIEMDAQAPVSSGLAQRKQPERLFSQAVSPKVRVLKQICDLRAKRHTTATGGASKKFRTRKCADFFTETCQDK